MGMIPGMDRMKNQINQEEAEQRMKRVEAIIRSMTAKERENPKILNASRRKRIAAGSGVQVRDVNEVLKQFRDMQTLMGQLRNGRMPNFPGAPRMR
jgi:signal recognition particle subunit SRP54